MTKEQIKDWNEAINTLNRICLEQLRSKTGGGCLTCPQYKKGEITYQVCPIFTQQLEKATKDNDDQYRKMMWEKKILEFKRNIFDRIYINECNKEYEIDVMDVDGKKTYMILVRNLPETEYKMFSIPCITFDTNDDAFKHAINTIKNKNEKE